MIKIDRNVPIPEYGQYRHYPWGQLQPGDSFFVPGQTISGLGGSISRARKVFGFKLISRTVTEDGVKGVRVWRVE